MSSTETRHNQHPADREAGVANGLSNRLPNPLTSFVGRESEIDALIALLDQPTTRLLTLTGPGGVGKTRLAISVTKAASLLNERPVTFIPLAPIRDPSLLASTIGAAFGLSESGDRTLAERLPAVVQGSSVLLVLDNFEHLTDAASLTSLLLSSCPTLTIMATSRRPLHVSGEIEHVVAPLATPGQDDSTEIIERSPSCQLFIERSLAGARGIPEADPRLDIEAIGAICSRLDGLPLAIELAAARTRVLPPAELLIRLERRLALLTDGPVDAPTRLRSMRDAIVWSYDLLTVSEQHLFRTLSVFSGGFTLTAVESVAPDDMDAPPLDLLTRLVDHSLVRRMETTAETARFTMLETVREFALDVLIAADEESDARDRHLAWMVEFVGSPTPDRFYELRPPADAAFLDELNNLRGAISWALDRHDAPRAAQVAWGLLRIWWHFGLTSEALESLQRLVDQPEGLDPVVHATVLEWTASFASHNGLDELSRPLAAKALEMFRKIDHTLGVNVSLVTLAGATTLSAPLKAAELFDQAVEIGRTLEDKRVLGWDLHWRSYAFVAGGEFQSALCDLEEAVALFEQFQIRDELRFDQSLAMNSIAWIWGLLGQFDLAASCVANGLAFSREYQVGYGMFSADRVLGELARVRGDLEESYAHLRKCLLTAHREALETWRTFVIVQIAMVAQAAGNWNQAARLVGFADASWTRFGFAESTRSMATWGYTTDETRLALGDIEFAAEFRVGGLLTITEAFDLASAMRFPERPQNRNAGLTQREIEVLAHLANGQTNAEIAAQLFVGKATVDTHVSHILAKLEVGSRLAAVKVARERGLLSS